MSARLRLRRWRLRRANEATARPPAATPAANPGAPSPAAMPQPRPTQVTKPAPGLWGAVEQVIDGATLIGWARSADGALPLTITVLREGKEIGTGATQFERRDIGGRNGFRVHCTEAFDPAGFVAETVKVMATRADGSSAPLRVVGPAWSEAILGVVRNLAGTLGEPQLELVVRALADHPAMAPRRAAVEAMLKPVDATPSPAATTTEALARLPPNQTNCAPHAQVGTIGVSIGQVSSDGSAVVGHDGHVFLVTGSNNLLAQYLADPQGAEIQQTAAAWMRLLAERADTVERLDARFLQVLMPEKLSVLPDKMPCHVTTPTPLLRTVEARIAADPARAAQYVSILATLSHHDIRAHAFPRMDTHLTPRGAYAVFRAICAAMGLPSPIPEPDFTVPSVIFGDLSTRVFAGAELPEVCDMPAEHPPHAWSQPVLVESIDPNRNLGTRRVWRNAAAPVDARVVAFANSFFERGGSARALSWWFARAFREFHFCWSPDLDAEYIRRVAPDWVICQSIERFMPQVPDS